MANAINLILLKDDRGFQTLDKLIRIKKKSYVFPEYMNPSTGRANWGTGASKVSSSLAFSAIRNLFFVDYPERLDLLPVPPPEWFKPGTEIHLEDLPSRFGLLSIRIVSTSNEVQFHFEKLPKFVPPDIMINLPFKTKIRQEDDFIVKKEEEMSYVINGWPSLVKCSRRR